jgi:hypothetical protein
MSGELGRNGRELEVSLAIRLSTGTWKAPVDKEDDGTVDDFLSSHGFEFIDIREPSSQIGDADGEYSKTRHMLDS